MTEDVIVEDVALRVRLCGRRVVTRYLDRALDVLPFAAPDGASGAGWAPLAAVAGAGSGGRVDGGEGVGSVDVAPVRDRDGVGSSVGR